MCSILLACISQGQAGGLSNKASMLSPWQFSAGGGYTKTNDFRDAAANSAALRISVARDLTTIRALALRAEVGVQSGQHGQLALTEDQQDILGGPAVQATINPFLDVLVGAQYSIAESAASTVFKIGGAWRQMHFDRDSMANKSRLQLEIQAGVDWALTERSTLLLAYQGIFGNNFRLQTVGEPFEGSGAVNTIPSQNGVLLTWSVRA